MSAPQQAVVKAGSFPASSGYEMSPPPPLPKARSEFAKQAAGSEHSIVKNILVAVMQRFSERQLSRRGCGPLTIFSLDATMPLSKQR
jgi:hypothetical protein